MPNVKVRVVKCLLAGVTVFFFSWVVCVNEWHGTSWEARRVRSVAPTMRTIVAYSEGKQAELDKPSPLTCDRLPAFPNIPHINRTWSPTHPHQESWQRVDGTRVSLYAAYYDQRAPQHYVRILASFHGRNISAEVPLFCQTRSLNPYEESVEVVAARPLEIWWHEWDTMTSDIETPLLLSCPLTELLYGPSTVSIVTQPCDDPTNAFSLEPSRSNFKYNRTFTICVKDMHFEKDVSQNLVEWIETNKILGVDMIDMYIDHITKDCEKVLLHYRDLGYIRLFHVPIHKVERSLWQRRRDHIITYNDCLYRNLRESEFIIPLDVDEIVLPKVAYTWSELLSRLIKHGWDPSVNSAILIQNAFFFDFMQGVEKYKVKRVNANKSKTYVKRDDVRILTPVGLDEIELIDDDNSVEVEVIDSKSIVKEFGEVKRRCGDVGVPKLARHVVRSAEVSPPGSYSKSLMLTRRVLTAFNHYPLASVGAAGFVGWSAPFSEVQLNHYKESCNSTVVAECARYGRRARLDTAARRLRRRLVRALARNCAINT